MLLALWKHTFYKQSIIDFEDLGSECQRLFLFRIEMEVLGHFVKESNLKAPASLIY